TITGQQDVLAGGKYSYSLNGTSAETGGVNYAGVVWVDYPSYMGMLSNVAMNTTNLPGPFNGYNAYYLPDGFQFYTGDSPGTTEVYAGEWYTFDITIPTDATVGATFGIDVLSSGFSIVQDAALTLTVVPEPITMALLGLGGLFLRRRK
ncbi:MAG TPA: PEP-CTERM sorting domain-containing protein, partial [Planctomycetes bacterium]|nr:PEP-CTERM sorting domain-containing protein [Planctomycetota bacterium]